MPGVRRTFLHRWAQGGAKTDPGDIKTDLGWIGEKPPFHFINWVMARVDDMLAHIEEQSVPDWDVGTAYLAGALSMGSDRVIYRAVQANSAINPTTDATETNWAPYVPAGTSAKAGLVELATGGETATGTDSSRAITPLGLLSRTATVGRAGVIELATDVETQALADLTRAVTPSSLGATVATDTAKGIVELANAAETLAGIDDTLAVSPASIGTLSQSLAVTGYKTFPGGLIIQWGSTVVNNQLDLDVVLPLAYPNAHLQAFASSALTGINENDNDAGAEPLNLTTIRLDSGQNTRTVRWFSIGH